MQNVNVLNSERSASFLRENVKSDIKTQQEGLPAITNSAVWYGRKRKVDRTRTLSVNASSNSSKVHNIELNNSPETTSSWIETSLILEKKQLKSPWLLVASSQTKLCKVEKKGFSQQLPMLHSSTVGRLGCQNIKTALKWFKHVYFLKMGKVLFKH